MTPAWLLTSSHLNTASIYYLLDLSSLSLLATRFLYFRSLFVFLSFLQFFRTRVVVVVVYSSSSNTTTNRNTATPCFSSSANTTKVQTKLRKPQYLSTYRENSRIAFNRPCTEQQSTFSSTSVSAERVKCRREPGTSILCFFFSSFFAATSLFLYAYILYVKPTANNN